MGRFYLSGLRQPICIHCQRKLQIFPTSEISFVAFIFKSTAHKRKPTSNVTWGTNTATRSLAYYYDHNRKRRVFTKDQPVLNTWTNKTAQIKSAYIEIQIINFYKKIY